MLHGIWEDGPIGFAEAKYSGFHLRDRNLYSLKNGQEVDDEVLTFLKCGNRVALPVHR